MEGLSIWVYVHGITARGQKSSPDLVIDRRKCPITAHTLGHNGRQFYVVSGDELGSITIDPIEDTSRRFLLGHHSGRIRKICCSTNDCRILSYGDDAIIRLWDYETRTQLMLWDVVSTSDLSTCGLAFGRRIRGLRSFQSH
jgi:WD40 repeat protein